MTKKIIALYDSNEDFICRLCSGFQQNCTLSLEFLPFTSLEKLLTFHSDHSISMLLTTEAMLTPQLISLFSETLILLSEENLSYKKNLPCLFKYQPCSQLFQDLMKLCSNQIFLTMEHSTTSAAQNLTLIGIYSPVARCGKTAFALAASQFLSEKNPTLFISFESCSGLSYFLSNNTAYTIGDLFYLLRHKKENPFAFLASLIQKNGSLHYLPPVCVPQDIWNLTSADCEALFALFAIEENPYQTLVLDFGPNLSAVFPVFSECNTLFLPNLKEPVSMAKSEQYKAYLTNTKQELILEKTHSCFLPPPDSSHFPDSFLSGVFGDAVKYELSKAGYL